MRFSTYRIVEDLSVVQVGCSGKRMRKRNEGRELKEVRRERNESGRQEEKRNEELRKREKKIEDMPCIFIVNRIC